jgi:hypothetical protein
LQEVEEVEEVEEKETHNPAKLCGFPSALISKKKNAGNQAGHKD